MHCYKGVHEQGSGEFEFFDDRVGQESAMIKYRNEICKYIKSEYLAATLSFGSFSFDQFEIGVSRIFSFRL